MAIDMTHDVDRLRGEIDEMRKDLKVLTRNMRDRGAEKGREALDQVEHLSRRARRHASRAEARFERSIEDRPVVSVVAAFGLGFLLAKLLDIGR